MKRALLMLCGILMTVTFQSCQQKTESFPKNIKELLKNVEITIEIDETKENAILRIPNENYAEIEYTSPASPLFGYKEIVDGDKMKTEFQNILWESKEVTTPLCRLLKKLRKIEDVINPKNKENHDNKQIIYHFQSAEEEFTLCYDKKEEKPISLLYQYKTTKIKLDFHFQILTEET